MSDVYSVKNEAFFTSNNSLWETPQKLFDELNQEFNFTIDVASNSKNHKCDRYFTELENGLLQSWEGETVFCNPPYGNIETGVWTKKCYEESLKPNTTVVLLIPARTDRKSFHDYIYKKPNVEIRFLKGRLKFEIDGIPKNSSTFPSMIVVFGERNKQ